MSSGRVDKYVNITKPVRGFYNVEKTLSKHQINDGDEEKENRIPSQHSSVCTHFKHSIVFNILFSQPTSNCVIFETTTSSFLR